MITLEIDDREFQQWFARYLRRTSRDIVSAVNKRAFFILLRAIKALGKSKPNEIREELLSPSRRAQRAPLAAILVQKKRRDEGLRGLGGKEDASTMRQEVKRLIAKRRSSAGYLKSFFSKAAQKLGYSFGRKYKNWNDWGRPNSEASPARTGQFPVAQFQSFVGEGGSLEIVRNALQRSYDLETQFIAERFATVLDPSSSARQRLEVFEQLERDLSSNDASD